jgi:hypothetical protein
MKRSNWNIANDLEGARSLGAAVRDQEFVGSERMRLLDVGAFGTLHGCEGPQPSKSQRGTKDPRDGA